MSPIIDRLRVCPERISLCHPRIKAKARDARRIHAIERGTTDSNFADPVRLRTRRTRTWPSRIAHVAFDPADHRPAPRRYAWSVFAILFALMVVDYVDRQVVVSMFSHLKAQWDLSDSQLGALVSIVSITVALGAVPLSLLADRWSRVKSIFLMALIWSLATIACAFAAQLRATARRARARRRGRGRVRHRRRRAAREPVSAADAQHGARRLPRGRHDRDRCWASCWAASSPSAGAGRPASAPSAFPGSCCALVFLLIVRDYKTVALPIPGRHGRHARASRRVPSSPSCSGRAPRSSPASAPASSCWWSRRPTRGCRATSTATTASRRIRRGSRRRIVVLVGGIGALRLERGRRPPELADSARPALSSPRPPRC